MEPPPINAPTTAGRVKCAEDVTESSTGTSLNRSGGAEYATTANIARASAAPDARVPTAKRYSANGMTVTADATKSGRCIVLGNTAPSTPPLRGLTMSDS